MNKTEYIFDNYKEASECAKSIVLASKNELKVSVLRQDQEFLLVIDGAAADISKAELNQRLGPRRVGDGQALLENEVVELKGQIEAKNETLENYDRLKKQHAKLKSLLTQQIAKPSSIRQVEPLICKSCGKEEFRCFCD